MFTLFPIPIFQKMKSSHKKKSFARKIFEDCAAAPKVSSPSDNWSKSPHSYVTYFLFPYFRKRTVPNAKYEQWAERFKTMHQAQRYVQQVIISQNFLVHMPYISYSHILENEKLDGNKELVMLLEKIPTVQKVCSTSDNRLKFPQSCLIYHLLIF